MTSSPPEALRPHGNLEDPALHVVLWRPEIPPNTGNIGRLCLGTGCALHLVHPIAFSIDEKAVRRAGLDYWKHVTLVQHADDDAFWQWAQGRRVHLFSSEGAKPCSAVRYNRGDVLVFGRETVGLPREWIERHGGVFIPMSGPIRSLNLANAVSVAVYGALRDVEPSMFPLPSESP